VGPENAHRTLWRESGASGCTRHKRRKAKKVQEMREDLTQRADAIRPEAGSVHSEKKLFLVMHKEYYDAGRKPDPNLQSGDMVWLLPRNIRTTRPCKKLDYKKIGSFKILAKIGGSAFKLNLPPSMRIHNTFHLSLLELYHDDKFPSQ